MKKVFLVDLISKIIKLRSVKRLVDIDQVLLDLSAGDLLSNVNMDELVRHNSHLLEGKSLNLSSGETLNDPALLLSFEGFDFLLDQVNDDLIINILEGLVAFSNTLSNISFLGNFFLEQILNGDELPVEVFGKSI